MRIAIVIAAALTTCASAVRASATYDSYDSFYAARPGTVFGNPIKSDNGTTYSSPGEQGIHTELRATLNGSSVSITLSEDRITINGRTYRYTSAATFSGERPSEFSPQTADVFLAGQTSAHPAVLCVQGDSTGSGEADRYKQVYLLINPLAPRRNATFLHLPSLLSSCRAVAETKSGKLVFPRNSYLLDDAQESRVGLLMSYYTYEDRHFIPISNDIRLQFARPDVPFQFSVRGKN